MLLYQFLLQRGLERRKVQEEFFNIVWEAIRQGGTKILQAPTGTGKTYGYLIPIIESGQKAIVSTGTKVLQEQLRKDIETLRSYAYYLYGKEISYLVLKGKSNYLCLDRYYNLGDGEKPSQIEDAIKGGWDGDFEFVKTDPELVSKLCVEDDYCDSYYRRMCRYRKDCYYWGKIKSLEKQAQILVVNHALLSLKEFEDAEERVLVIDEAHELDKYVSSSLRSGVSLYALRVEVLGRIRSFIPDANVDVEGFFVENFERFFHKEEEEIPLESLEPYRDPFERDVIRPMLSLHRRIQEKLIYEIVEFLQGRMFVSLSLKEYLYRIGLLDWKKYLDIKANYQDPSPQEESMIKKLKTYELLSKKLQKVRDFHKLMEGKEASLGYLIGRRWSKKLQTYNYWLETFPVFPAGYTDFSNYKALIITSATVDPEDLKQTFAISGDYHKLSYTFPYSRIDFIVYDTDPKRVEWKDCLLEGYRYLKELYPKVLLLLTNKEQKGIFQNEYGIVFQGEDSLSELLQSLKDGRLKALAGFDSLWLGVDVQGKKGILMAKLPFDSPEDPITFHRIRFLKQMGENPFKYQKRKALIKFRQGIGRMMRTREDSGTIILCDRRIFKFKEFLDVLRELGIVPRLTSL